MAGTATTSKQKSGAQNLFFGIQDNLQIFTQIPIFHTYTSEKPGARNTTPGSQSASMEIPLKWLSGLAFETLLLEF